MFDIYLLSSDLPWYEEIKSIIIDFEEYTRWIVKDCIPVWNLEKMNIVTDIRPEWSPEISGYRHIINGRRLLPNTSYLLADNQIECTCHATKQGIEIYCDDEKERVWELYRVEENAMGLSEYEIFRNEICSQGLNAIRTLGGITRIIKGLGYEDRFVLKRIEPTDKCEGQKGIYSVEEINELADCSKHEVKLKLVLKSKKNDYLQMDILSYLVSEVQRMYPEVDFIVDLI